MTNTGAVPVPLSTPYDMALHLPFDTRVIGGKVVEEDSVSAGGAPTVRIGRSGTRVLETCHMSGRVSGELPLAEAAEGYGHVDARQDGDGVRRTT
jgi:hypothetical protein